MKLHRIQALLLRHWYHYLHDIGGLIASIYWPLIDLLLWGLTSVYLQSISTSNIKIVTTLVSGTIFWLMVHRSFFELTVPIIWERWDRNLINMFAAPLKISEWITAILILGLTRIFVGFTFVSIIAAFFYKVQILTFGVYLLPFLLLLLMSGWWMAFLVAGADVLFGRKVDVFIWTIVALLSPFSAIFYPVSTLPSWAQTISHVLPQSYVFEGMREVLQKGTVNQNFLTTSAALNIVYLLLSVLFFYWCFKKLLDKGLIKAS